MSKEYKIGLLGFGSMGKTHLFSATSLPFYYSGCGFEGKYVSVCTSRLESAKKAQDQFGFLYATDNEDDIINDPDVDIIDICTPNIYHFESAKKAIAAGKHVLCEKPMCVDAESAKKLCRLAKENGVFLMEAMWTACLPAMRTTISP